MITVLFFYLIFPAFTYLAVTRYVVFLFCLYQFIYFLNPQTKWWATLVPDLRYSFYVVLVLLLITLFRWPKLNNKILSAPQFKWLFGIGILYSTASQYAVLPTVHAIATDAIITAITIVTIIYKLCEDEKALKIIIKGYIFSASYMAFYVTQFGRISGGRYTGGGMVDAPTENGIAAALAPALVLSGYYIWKEPKKYKFIYLITAGLLANALVQIGSRSSFLAVAVGSLAFFTFMFFSRVRKRNQRLKVIAMVVVGLSVIPFITDQIFWERFFSIKTDSQLTQEQETGSTRVFFWKAAIDMAKDHPFGGGASAFIYYSPYYIDENVDTGGSRRRAVHSTWFEALTEIGYLGLLFVIMLVISVLNGLRKAILLARLNKDTETQHLLFALTASVLCFVVSMTFMSRLRAEIFYWLVLFSMCAYNIYYLKRKDAISKSKIDAETTK